MKIEFKQSEENGQFKVSLKGEVNGIVFATQHSLEPPHPITKETKDNTIQNCIQDFIGRYYIELGRTIQF